ncbi:MAG: ABC transporter ATP-binding protein [Betaproteobacteria bacterium]|nr:ABC transporter ATP-binding protein [Betaproteobacteria bacterium]MDE2622020.1 ABC transporter ATP-binding protein [Betaproteobacteria bacterium]
MSPLLQVRNLCVHYGGIKAVEGLNLDVMEGERVTLIGANGAGKSSTLKAIAGLVAPADGVLAYAGQALRAIPAWQRVGKGLALVPEGRGVFNRLTIEENLLMGAYHRKDSEKFPQELDHVYSLFTRLHERRYQQAGTLSGGEQQMLAIGRALMSRPRLLMLDEPSMGLAPVMVEKIFSVIRKIAEEGVTLLLVEQNARLALEVCDRAYVMESGQVVLVDTASACMENPMVRSAYLGDGGG